MSSSVSPTAYPRRMSRVALLIGAALFAGGFFIMATGGLASGSTDTDAASADTPQSTAPIVETAAPVSTSGFYKISAPGRLQARQGTALIGEIAGKIVWISDNYVIGGRVKEGELLFRIDQSDYLAAVKSAEAALTSATATLVQAEKLYERRRDLIKNGFVSDQATDDATANLANAKATVAQAEAQLDQAKKNLERTEIRAPYPARVIDETMAPDTYVAPGQQLGIITDTRMGELVASLSPRDSKALADVLVAGQRVAAKAVPNEGSISTGSLDGWVDRFVPVIDRASRTAQIIALFPGAFEPQNDGKIFGDDFMTLELEIPLKGDVYEVPTGTVRKESFVWAVRGGKLAQLPVTVLSHSRSTSLITSPVPLASERVLVTLLNEEHEGKEVSVITSAAAR